MTTHPSPADPTEALFIGADVDGRADAEPALIEPPAGPSEPSTIDADQPTAPTHEPGDDL